MKYLRLFETESEYQTYVDSGELVLPNVSYIREVGRCNFRPYILPSIEVGDVAYWDGSSVKTVSLDGYDVSMGTAVGVVVIPENFLPDGRARMVALKQSNTQKEWGPEDTDISDLVNYNRFPITDNAGSTTTGSNIYGYLPSDSFRGASSFVDPSAKYSQTGNLIPSPYLSDGTLNPEYMKTINGYNNALSDFDGKGNTNILVGLGSDYAAANHAKDYTIDGVSGIDWYLPACGELGVMLTRLGSINKVISTLGGVAVPTGNLWTSSESSSNHAYDVYAYTGFVSNISKSSNYVDVRSFALV